MTTFVSGSLRLSSGQIPSLFATAYGEVKWETRDIPYECEILGGHIIVRYPHGIRSEDVADEIFKNTRALVENVVLAQIVKEGVGLMFAVEYCRRDDGTVVQALPDKAPAIIDIQFDYQKVFNLMGGMPQLRYAVRDFNQGLINREDCPFFFYRAIETLAKLICNTDNLTSQKWDSFHSRIGTTYEEMKSLHEISQKHRHGEHMYFTGEQHLEIRKTVRYFILKSIQFLLD